jgi:hypothetical protein
MVLDEGIRRLLEQCDREDQCSPTDKHYLHTSEIRHLLGAVNLSEYAILTKTAEEELV